MTPGTPTELGAAMRHQCASCGDALGVQAGPFCADCLIDVDDPSAGVCSVCNGPTPCELDGPTLYDVAAIARAFGGADAFLRWCEQWRIDVCSALDADDATVAALQAAAR